MYEFIDCMKLLTTNESLRRLVTRPGDTIGRESVTSGLLVTFYLLVLQNTRALSTRPKSSPVTSLKARLGVSRAERRHLHSYDARLCGARHARPDERGNKSAFHYPEHCL